MNATIAPRDWLKLLTGAATGVLVLRDGSGCGCYSAESGDAYAPWTFPGAERRPEMVAARAAILDSDRPGSMCTTRTVPVH